MISDRWSRQVLCLNHVFSDAWCLGHSTQDSSMLRFALLGLVSTHFLVDQRLGLHRVVADQTVELCLRSDDFGMDI